MQNRSIPGSTIRIDRQLEITEMSCDWLSSQSYEALNAFFASLSPTQLWDLRGVINAESKVNRFVYHASMQLIRKHKKRTSVHLTSYERKALLSHIESGRKKKREMRRLNERLTTFIRAHFPNLKDYLKVSQAKGGERRHPVLIKEGVGRPGAPRTYAAAVVQSPRGRIGGHEGDLGENNKDRELSNAHNILRRQRKQIAILKQKLKGQSKIGRDELWDKADQNCFKNGKINYSSLARTLGVTYHTAWQWCQTLIRDHPGHRKV